MYTIDKNQIILIESPEAHLPPSAQKKLGQLIALSTSSNKQIIIETHSEYIIDGIRTAVVQNKVNSSDIKFHFFRKKSFEEETIIETPEFHQNGKFSFYPEGCLIKD